MRVSINLNKYEKKIVQEWAKEKKCKPWKIMWEISTFANEEVFKKYFEKTYKKEKQE